MERERERVVAKITTFPSSLFLLSSTLFWESRPGCTCPGAPPGSHQTSHAGLIPAARSRRCSANPSQPCRWLGTRMWWAISRMTGQNLGDAFGLWVGCLWIVDMIRYDIQTNTNHLISMEMGCPSPDFLANNGKLLLEWHSLHTYKATSDNVIDRKTSELKAGNEVKSHDTNQQPVKTEHQPSAPFRHSHPKRYWS